MARCGGKTHRRMAYGIGLTIAENRMQLLRNLALLTSLLFYTQAYAANAACTDTRNGYGPYDYTSREDRETKLPIVEHFHFNADVENLVKGMSSGVLGDLNYTLRAFPNHHRALMALANYRISNPQTPEALDSAECYFTRALAFRPNDPIVHMIYGIYFHKKGKFGLALEQMLEAEKLDPNNANIQYNLGLLYYDKKDLDQAEVHARNAYDMGFPLPRLKEKLKKAGRLKEVAVPEKKSNEGTEQKSPAAIPSEK